jgi:hypothetical protein
MSNRTNRTADDCKACDELERLSVLKDRPSHNAFLHLRLAQQCTCGMCEETGFTAALSAEVSHGRNDMVSLAVHVLPEHEEALAAIAEEERISLSEALRRLLLRDS